MFIRIHKLTTAGIALGCGLMLASLGSNTASTAQAAGAAQNGLIPPLMLPYGSGWAAGGSGTADGADVPPDDFLPPNFLHDPKYVQAALARGIPADEVAMYLQVRVAGQRFIPPASGLGEIEDDPHNPYISNSDARHHVGTDDTARIADLTDAAAKNAKPWVLEALKKQNALVLAGQNIEPRVQRCWELGVPGIDEISKPLYFIQTPTEVVMYLGKYARHIYMNVPHSKHLTPSWYGESVGHYEGDTLVVDTIGQNDKTLIDSYRTPHSSQIHVVERFRVISSGKGLDTSITVSDPGAFYKPFGMRRPRWFIDNHPLQDGERICAAGNEDHLHIGLEPMQEALTPDF